MDPGDEASADRVVECYNRSLPHITIHLLVLDTRRRELTLFVTIDRDRHVFIA